MLPLTVALDRPHVLHIARPQVENVECFEPDQIKFDFLGKDSIRYENTVTVDPTVRGVVWHGACVRARAGLGVPGAHMRGLPLRTDVSPRLLLHCRCSRTCSCS